MSVKNTLELEPELDDDHDNDSYFDNTADLIAYLGKNIKSVQLLTDGLRIGQGQNVGTVFNVSGEYNRFFFLSNTIFIIWKYYTYSNSINTCRFSSLKKC